MKISINLNYYTRWGESLSVYGDILQLGGGDYNEAVEMKPSAPGIWTLDLELEGDPIALNYNFLVKSEGIPCRFEWGKPHHFVSSPEITKVELFDSWRDMPDDLPYYSSAFTRGFLHRECADMPLPLCNGMVRIQVNAPMVFPDEYVAITGKDDYLGNWNPEKALPLNDSEFPKWTINLPVSRLDFPLEFKFIIKNKKTGKLVVWEDGENRRLQVAEQCSDRTMIFTGLVFSNPRKNWKGSGTAIPVFSIRTEEDFGVGDFLDLKKMVDWCEATGQKVLQILPINDTTKSKTWRDCYPYSANSAFALHPMYLRPEAMGLLDKSERREHYRKIARELNQLPSVDYEAVNKWKHEYFREIFNQNGKRDLKSKEFRAFFSRNESWLRPYAAWCVLRDKFDSPDHSRWESFKDFNFNKMELILDKENREVSFYYFLQYHLDRQLKSARDYAHMHGVVLKGDIPIGIGRDSADAWQLPRLFNMDCQAGAPPDDFSIYGQNWGFPTYNWEEMEIDGFQWWKSRFRKMAEYFDAYRIDHILGFFRIWQIPLDAVHGLLGYFHPALPFSANELKKSFEFYIIPEIHCRPLINDWILDDLFGPHTLKVKSTFLESEGDGRYRLQRFVDTQRKVVDYFYSAEYFEENLLIKEGLLTLLDNVLFIEDPYEQGKYHPRISGDTTYQFKTLPDADKKIFRSLYHDFYYERHNEFWATSALKKLPAIIGSTGMLPCGEDLGMIPSCVPDVMRELEILSLEIQRMPKEPWVEFGDTTKYPYFSVSTTSTHDMGGIRLWWESNHGMAQRFYNDVLKFPGEAPVIATPEICSKIICLQLESPSMFTILPLADWLSADGLLRHSNPLEEQINDPSDDNHYWKYRLHLTVEQMLSENSFIHRLRNAIIQSSTLVSTKKS